MKKSANQQTIRIDIAVESFLIDCAARRLTPLTRAGYKQILDVFQRWCADNELTSVSEITRHHLRKAMVDFAEREYSGQYQHNIARTVKAFLNFCVRDEIIEESPFTRLLMPKVEQYEIKFFTTVEIGKILKACLTDRDSALCMVLLDTGIRASELIALNIGSVKLKDGSINVRLGKGQKERTVFIGAKARRQINRYLRTRPDAGEREPLFLSQRGDRLRRDGLIQLVTRLRERSGIKHCTCHTFRRTFAYTCLRNGMNIYAIAKLMGHANITVLKRYLTLAEADLQDAHERYGVMDNL